MLFKGRVVDLQTNEGIENLRIELWDKNADSHNKIGEARSRAEGTFQIEIERSRLDRRTDRAPDIFLRIFSDAGELLKSTEDAVLEDWSPTDTEIIFTIESLPRSVASRSEFEILRSRILPLVRGPLSEVSDERIKKFSEATKIPAERIAELIASERLALETRLPAELFFGLSRQGLPIKLDKLLATNPSEFGKAIASAIENKQIPLSDDGLKEATNLLSALATRRTPVDVLVSRSGLQPSAQLQALLRKQNISTLSDLRRTGGFSFREDLSDSDRAVAAHLDAQARLLTLHPDPAITTNLINKGYSSIGAIAHADPAELGAALGQNADAPLIRTLINQGKAQHAFVQSVSFGLTATRATKLQTVDEWAANHPIHEVLGEKCSCKDCDAAVSPRAYLADLMQYAIDHLRDGTQPVDLSFFEGSFHQPFGSLPATCAGMDEEVRQVRICIEVLRNYLGPRPLGDAAREATLRQAEQRYRQDVYQLILKKLGTNLSELRLFRAATEDEQKQIADRIGVHPAAVPGIYFDPSFVAQQSMEQSLERQFGLVDTTQPPLRNRPDPIFTNARRNFIRTLWRSQDWPSDDYSLRTVPIVDPDLLGPDDFRWPYAKANPAMIDRPFDLWIARREWADDFLDRLRNVPQRQLGAVAGPDFSRIVNTIGVPYRGRGVLWPPNSLASIRTMLANLTNENSESTTQQLRRNYGLSLDAARRLIELGDKDALFWRNPERAPKLDELEWEDVFAILLKAVKNSLGDFWITEENETAQLRAQANELPPVWISDRDASQVLFGQQEFWKSIREPAEGNWPPVRVSGVPLVDPELVKRDELPETVAGRKTPGQFDIRTIWDQRAAELRTKQADLENLLSTTNFEAVLAEVFGQVPAPATTWTAYLHSATDPAATLAVANTLHLTIEEFQQLLTTIDGVAGVGGPQLPSRTSINETWSTLVSAWKVRTLYSRWTNEETDAATGYELWRCRRHYLPKWRATVEERQRWQRALALRSRPPLVDPDLLISAGYFTQPGSIAWTIWNQRQMAIAAKFQDLRGRSRTLAQLDQLGDEFFGAGVLTELGEARKLGRAISPRLQQLNLSFDSFQELLRIRELLAVTPPQPVLDDEWDAVASILTQVWKQRRAPEWLLEERARDVFLYPVLFQLIPVDLSKFPPTPRPQLDRWRGLHESLMAWEERLQSRIDQERDVIEAVERAVSEAEAQTLPALRDALITAASPLGFSFAQSARWLGDHLAVATEYSGCQKTTRISQAIETFQGILWGVRSGIFADDHPNLRLIGENFDEEWNWIGSYAMWRAAMFVLLYPENLLLPSLRRVQSPAFRELVDELRNGPRLTIARARQVAEQYSSYFRDICTLDLKASCRAITRTPTGDRQLLYLLAKGGETGAIYWCFYDSADQTGYPLSFWKHIDGLAGKNATIIGADSYQIFFRRYLYLFLILESEGDRDLAFTRFDLHSRTWSGEPTPLALPGDAGTFTATLMERLHEEDRPTIAIKASNGRFYQRSLNGEGLDWAEGDWVPRDRVWLPWRSVAETNSDSQVTSNNLKQLKPGSRFFASPRKGFPSLVYLATLGKDSQVYGFKWNHYSNPPFMQRFDVPQFTGVLGGEGGISGIARDGTLPNTTGAMPQIDLFAVTNNGALFTAHWDLLNGWAGNQWTQLSRSVDQVLANSFVSVTAREPNTVDIIVPPPAGIRISVWKTWGKRTQYSWEHGSVVIPLPYYENPIVLTSFAPRPSRLELIYNEQIVDPTGEEPPPEDPSSLIHLRWTGQASFVGVWAGGNPVVIPESKDVAPAAQVAVGVRPAAFDVFVPRTTGGVWTARRVLDAGWSKWTRVGAETPSFTGDAFIATLNRTADNVLLFAIDDHGPIDINGTAQDHGVVHCSYQRDDGSWERWAPVNFPPTVLFKPGSFVSPVLGIESSTDITVRLFAIDFDGVFRWTEGVERLPLRVPENVGFSWKPTLWTNAVISDLVITDRLTDIQRRDRSAQLTEAYNQNLSRSISAYLEEMFYFVPLHIALRLQQSGEYLAALDWFRLVYDYAAPRFLRQLIGMPPASPGATDGFVRNIQNWLLDPLNPHSIAATRPGTYARYTLLAIIRCLLDYADSEFTRDTAETVPRARELYETALDLLDWGELKQTRTECEEVIGQLRITLTGSRWDSVKSQIQAKVQEISSVSDLKVIVQKLNKEFELERSDQTRYEAVLQILNEPSGANGQQTSYAGRLTNAGEKLVRIESAVIARPDFAEALQLMSGGLANSGVQIFKPGSGITMAEPDAPATGALPASLAFDFCVPVNPVLRALRLRAGLNLYKLNNCRNIAGLERQIEAFAAPTDTVSGMPVIGAGGQLSLPGTNQFQATVYRYPVLIERAKQIAQNAIQLEAAFLSALEKSDRETYDVLSARADVRLAQAGLRLQDLRILEAQDGVRAAQMQSERAQIQANTYDQWINQGLTSSELALLGWYDWLAAFQIVAAVAEGGIQALTGSVGLAALGPFAGAAIATFNVANAARVIAQSLAINAQREISRLNVLLAFERRLQELTLQRALAAQDILIGDQQIVLANDRVRISEQEREIERLKADHAKEVLDFLTNKFTNKELYDWMSNVLEGVYGVLLQQATSVAKLASVQLAFERQEPVTTYIQDDYWQAPSDGFSNLAAEAPDRRGLTGSARLLQDISQLDQYAFERDRRKQSLTKTFSLAQHDPLAFQRFIETGVLPFVTSLEQFDRDFPGHYLRLIKRVRTSVIALIPPTFGVKAALTASGLSRVVIGGDVFQIISIRRPPEVVSLSAPANASGVFDLQQQPEMLLPFEGNGVATTWEFALPKAANRFDFSTIADVLISIDYTALSSFDYRQQVTQALNARRSVSEDRAFSFRHNFADAWYDLHNPELTSRPMSVTFETRCEDFPSNVENLRIEHVTLYFSRRPGRNIEFDSVDLRLMQSGAGALGGIGRTDHGVISTRAGDGSSWLGMRDASPFGEWQLTLSNTEDVREFFKNGDINDILLIVTYGGRIPEW